MEKIDFKKQFKQFYRPSAKQVDAVDIPTWNYLMIDGEGDPDSTPAFTDAIEALYPLSYTLKFMIKKGDIGVDYGVLPLEGLWWADDLDDFVNGNKANWRWTLMMMQPEWITPGLVDEAMEKVGKKKNPTSLSRVRFEPFTDHAHRSFF